MVEKQKDSQKATAEKSKKPVDQCKPYKFTKDQLHRTHFIWTTAPGATMHQWLDSDEQDERVYFFTCLLMKASPLWMNNKIKSVQSVNSDLKASINSENHIWRWFQNILEVPKYPAARCGINGNGSEIS